MKVYEYKSNLERNYALWLDWRQKEGQIQGWTYEAIKLRIGLVGENAWYTPDFLVVDKSGALEIHETKGYRERAGMVRFKAAVALHPHLRFRLIQQVKDKALGWKVEEF